MLCLALLWSGAVFAGKGDGDPRCVWAGIHHIPCPKFIKPIGSVVGQVTIASIAPWQGNTPATVSAQFPKVMLWTLQTNPAINAQLLSWAPIYWARLSTEMSLASSADQWDFLYVAVQKLSAPTLIKMRAAFGIEVDTYVSEYAPAATRSAYFAASKLAPVPRSFALYQAKGLPYTPNPKITMTVYDIFLEYYAAEGATITSAIVQATRFATGELGWAFGVGLLAGETVLAIADAIDPGINEQLASELGALIQDTLTNVDVYLSAPPSGQGYAEFDEGSYTYCVDGNGNTVPCP
jgi:hypothetical protein